MFAILHLHWRKERRTKKNSPTISKWCNGGVFKESLSIIIKRGGRGRRVREWEWEWDEFFCAETWLRNILFCVLFLGSSISTFVLWNYLINFGSIFVFIFKIKRKNVCLLWRRRRRRRRRTHYHVFVACGMFEFCISSKWCSIWS